MGLLRLKPSPALAVDDHKVKGAYCLLLQRRNLPLVRSGGSSNQGDSSPNLVRFKKVELSIPKLVSSRGEDDEALFKRSSKGLISQAAEKLNFVARLKLKLDVSFDTNFHQPEKMQRRELSVLVVFTTIWLMGPVAAASFSSSDAAVAATAAAEVPEYGPGLPKKEIVFTGDVFVARVARPVKCLEDGAQIPLPMEDGDDDEEAEEVLELSLSVPRTEVTAFDCFVNLPDASKSSRITLPEFVGSYHCEVDTRPGFKKVKVSFGISDKIRMFNLMNEPSILVAMVKRSKNVHALTINDIDVTLE